jgi:Tol biopolymer transport system component
VDGELWIVEASSGETRVASVIPDPRWGQNELEWSRDGLLIALSEPGRIRLVGVDGGADRVIPAQGDARIAPRSLGWTDGDDRIVYISTDGPGDGLAVIVVNADGSNTIQLSSSSDELHLRFYDAVVSAGGDRVAFAQAASRCSTDANGDQSCAGVAEPVLVMDVDGSDVIELPLDLGFGSSGLQWSPDAEQLVFGSLSGVTSINVSRDAAPVTYSREDLNLEWSRSELTWQPLF